MKKIFWKQGACAVAAVAILTGCSTTATNGQTQSVNTQEPEAAQTGPVTLTVWAEESDFDMLNGMITSFREHYADQADFEISLVPQPDSGTSDVILGDIHSAGDVFSFPDDQFSRLMAAGVLAPVDNAEAVSAANVAESIAAASYQGTLYAFPYTADNGYFLYYDKNYFTPEDVKTLDGILAVASVCFFRTDGTGAWHQ